MNTQHTKNLDTKNLEIIYPKIIYLCYESEYEEIYESTYGTSFIFVDEDDEELETDFDINSLIPPEAPTGFC